MTLSQKERGIAQLWHQETDFIPNTLNDFEGDLYDRVDDHYGSPAWRDLLDDAVRSMPGLSANILVNETIVPLSTDIYGSTWRVDRCPTHLMEPAIKVSSMEGFTFPAIDTIFKPDWKEKSMQVIEQYRDHFLVTGFSFGLFERTWTLRGFEHAPMDAVVEHDFYEELVEQITNHQMEIVDHLVQLPVDDIIFSDDWGYQDGVLIGAKRWRKILKPRLARLYERTQASGKYVLSHCCGSIEEIIPDLIEFGLDVYERVQPEAKNNNPYELKRKYGDKITFWGGLGSQSIIPFGPPDEIKAEVARMCNEMRRGGGYLLSLSKNLQPETPTQNAAAVVEAFFAAIRGQVSLVWHLPFI